LRGFDLQVEARPVSAVSSAVLLTLCLSVCADAQSLKLGVFTNGNRLPDSVAVDAIEKELQQLFSPAEIQVDWKTGRQDANEEYEHIVVGSFTGTCSVAEFPNPSKLQSVVALGETSVSRGGILPFFTVKCDRIIQMLRPILEPLSMPLRQTLFGRGVARVAAHEIYHILAHTPDHDESGVAKASFSAGDLIAEGFGFKASSLHRLPKAAVLSAGR
jgi:hypothetical protein